jgi:hypothetical protein
VCADALFRRAICGWRVVLRPLRAFTCQLRKVCLACLSLTQVVSPLEQELLCLNASQLECLPGALRHGLALLDGLPGHCCMVIITMVHHGLMRVHFMVGMLLCSLQASKH